MKLPEKFHLKLKIYDSNGKFVKNLVDKKLSPGDRIFYWDGKNNSGKEVPSGLYFYTIKTDKIDGIKKIIFLT